jgi:hypothetical protein
MTVISSECGALAQPSPILARDVGVTCRLGFGTSAVLWLFGDTLVSGGAPDGLVRSCSGAVSGGDPLAIAEPMPDGYPVQFLPFTDEERAWNLANPQRRIALWPTSAVRSDDGSALIFYTRITQGGAGPALGPDYAGLARLAPAADLPVRFPQPLWMPGAPIRPTLGAVIDGAYLYAFALRWAPAADALFDVLAGRVRTPDLADPAAWRFWGGDIWRRKPSLALPVARGGGGISVSRHPRFDWLMTWSGMWTDVIYAATASAPQGPWSAPVELHRMPSTACYSAFEHPEYATDAALLVTYYLPLGGLRGELRAVRVEVA